ncbi:MAG: A/G-specific adenine glycosylase [Alphaproteobacteria bacterium]
MQKIWVENLIAWFDNHQRDLPWRATKTNKVAPWQVWVSEVMLQQTTVATVYERYIEFMERWPSFEKLAQASEDDILHFWQGLGYYSRARNLYKGIQYIKDKNSGKLPQSFGELKKVSGIGDYTAAAIASIAFNQKEAAIDGNVARLLARFWLMDEVGEKLKVIQRKKLKSYIPKKAGDFTQALIELGALICRPNNPQCEKCPIKTSCKAYLHGKVISYPKKSQKKEKEIRYGRFYLIKDTKNQLLFWRRGDKGLLASLYVLPSNNWYKDESIDIENLIENIEDKREHLFDYKHIFTHIELRVSVYRLQLKSEIPRWNNAYWLKLEDIKNIALPTVIKKALS